MDFSLSSGTGQLIVAVVVVYLSGLAYFVNRGYHVRRQYKLLADQGMPMPPWHPILGHLLSLPPILKTLPKDTQQPYIFEVLSSKFAESDTLFYMDLWPFSNPLLLVASPSLAIQACQQHDLPKPHVLDAFFRPFAGGDNLFTMNGSEWKRSRALFNPGFQANYLLGQMSHIVEETSVYVDVLREHAQKGDMFSLDEVTLWFTMDIIGTVSLYVQQGLMPIWILQVAHYHAPATNIFSRDSRLHSQRRYNPLASAMRSQVLWHCTDDELNPFIRWNPVRPVVQWWNSRKMNNYISNELDKRFAERQSKGKNKDSASRSVIDLALESYMADNPTLDASKGMDKTFKAWAITQIRLFLFAGHDSTSSTICYIFYLLAHHPDCLARLRAEHDEVFGTDLLHVTTMLTEQPHLINQLPYTLAVMKESLRLFPPASAMRGGRPGVSLQDSRGNQYPTASTNIWILHHVLQRNPDYWKDPDSFIPDRWLVGPEDPLYPVRGAWRPFEFGPRNCVGQTLVTLDVRVALVMTVREFDINDAYEEWDRLHPTKDIKTVRGERAYQVSSGGAHPADGFPCRVSLRK